MHSIIFNFLFQTQVHFVQWNLEFMYVDWNEAFNKFKALDVWVHFAFGNVFFNYYDFDFTTFPFTVAKQTFQSLPN